MRLPFNFDWPSGPNRHFTPREFIVFTGVIVTVALIVVSTLLSLEDILSPKFGEREESVPEVESNINVTALPGYRSLAGMVFDKANNRLIMFGGRENYRIQDPAIYKNDIWEYRMPSETNPYPKWRKMSPTGTPPSPRNASACVYDVANQRMVCFGGWAGGALGGFYELTLPSDSDGEWKELRPEGDMPEPRYTEAIYDAKYQRMIIFGGNDGFQDLRDLYAVTLPSKGENGISIKYTDVPAELEQRSEHSLIYDAKNQTIVLFGGWGDVGYNDVWKLTLPEDLSKKSWTELFPAGAPPYGRHLHEAIYDAQNQRMIVYGGIFGTEYPGDIWQLTLPERGNGIWTRKISDPEETPLPLKGMAAVYDDLKQAMIIFGGIGGTAPFYLVSDLLIVDLPSEGEFTFRQLAFFVKQSASDAGEAIYDSDNKRMIMFGGYGRIRDANLPGLTGVHINEVWSLETSGELILRNVSLPIGPLGRELPSVIYDKVNKRLIIFSGIDGNGHRMNDTWSLPLGAFGVGEWGKFKLVGEKPLARWGGAAIYDSKNQRMIVFGGANNKKETMNDVWELSLKVPGKEVWINRTPKDGVSPLNRWETQAVYDPVNQRMVIFGGFDGVGKYMSDVWELDLSVPGKEKWSEISIEGGPGPRRGHTGLYDSLNKRMVVFGGYDGKAHYNDTWYLNIAVRGEERWEPVSINGTPPAKRRSHVAIYDPGNQRMIIHSGRGEGSPLPFYNDYWEFTLPSSGEATWRELKPQEIVP